MPEYDQDHIEKFIRGTLSTAEHEAFIRKMEDDEKLQAEVAFMRDLQKGIDQHFNRKLKERLQEQENKIKIRQRNFSWIGIAASVAVVSIVSYLSYLLVNRTDAQTIFAEQFEPYPNFLYPVERTASAGDESEAFSYYEAGQFEKAIASFKDLLQEKTDHEPYLRFYLGVSYLAEGQAENAVAAFEPVISSTETTRISIPVRWYLALAYLKLDQPDRAEPILKNLVEGKSSYAPKANQILESL